MLGRTLATWLTALGTGLALAPAASADTPAVSAETSYTLYCSSCHGPNGEGAEASQRPREHAPALSALAAKYGTPLPRESLAKFVLLDTRPGGGHICGDRLLPGVPGLRSRGPLERMVVAEALDHLEALQQQNAGR